MKSNRTPVWIAGFLLFLSIVATFVLILPGKPSGTKELGFDEMISKIKSKEIGEVTIRQDSVELIGKNKEKYFTNLDAGDETREIILSTINTINEEKTGAIKTTLEPKSSGWGWIVFINAVPFFIMWGLTLAVIVYAVRTLSRNKS